VRVIAPQSPIYIFVFPGTAKSGYKAPLFAIGNTRGEFTNRPDQKRHVRINAQAVRRGDPLGRPNGA
jgi:hypothetical protein